MSSILRCLMLSVACVIALTAIGRAEVRVKDITTVEGVRANKLYGLGLVVGLNGTGGRSGSTQQVAIEMLAKLESNAKLARQSLLDNVYKSTNISVVMVTADLPPFARKGSELDVVVSVFDDAQSLEGGTLIQTPMRGADGEVYAVAQGQLSIGGFRVRSSGTGGQVNHPTVARALKGAIIEKEALGQVSDKNGNVRLLLRDADFATAKSIMQSINGMYPSTARTIDPGVIQIRVPAQRRSDMSDFVSEIGLLKVMPDTPARVVINERTGTVIVGHQVRISSVAIAHGNLVIKPNVSVVAATPSAAPAPDEPPGILPGLPPDENGDPIDNLLKDLRRKSNASPPDTPLSLHNVEQTFTVADLARILNALGVSPRDLIAIFQALHESGAMHAELILM